MHSACRPTSTVSIGEGYKRSPLPVHTQNGAARLTPGRTIDLAPGTSTSLCHAPLLALLCESLLKGLHLGGQRLRPTTTSTTISQSASRPRAAEQKPLLLSMEKEKEKALTLHSKTRAGPLTPIA
jgi:hypothetical protein